MVNTAQHYIDAILDMVAAINLAGRKELVCPLRSLAADMPKSPMPEQEIWPAIEAAGITVNRIKINGEPRVHLTWE